MEKMVSRADDGGGKNNERSGIGGRTADSERVGGIIEREERGRRKRWM